VSAPADGVAAVAVTMAHALRRRGVAVPPDSSVAFAAALGEVGIDRRSVAYWAGRATLVRRPEDVAAYDEVFASIFDGQTPSTSAPAVVETVTRAVDDAAAGEAGATGTDAPPLEGPMVALRWSDAEVLRRKDFADCTAEELAEIHRRTANLQVAATPRRSNRLRPTRRPRGHIDLRTTVRRSLRSSGEPLRWAYRAPGERARRLVLLCDVSGSMEPYARALVRFAHVAVSRGSQVEVFTLGTRCTRITRQLRTHDADAALAAAGESVADWSGGTRLGEGVRAFNERWGASGMARGAVVVVLSDGWDRGDPTVLAEQMARLHRLAHRVVWVNPLKASPGFAPSAQGMAAALPYVDELVEGHSFASLEALVGLVGAKR
jgi:uncharacterized protein with von Willebrand factor type A (vWA) domain